MTPANGMRAGTALAVTVLLVAVLAALVAWQTDRPLLSSVRRAGIAQRAALAIRDKVVPFQQWGTRSFTLPGLETAYGQVEYMTITDPAVDSSGDFVQRLEHLARTHEVVDLFLLAHTNQFVAWTERVDAGLRKKLRLVYNTGCFDLGQKDRWMALGARSYIGHVGLSESPVFYVYFLRRWLRGESLGEVVATGNALTGRVLGGWYALLQINRRATTESTFAELTGDATVAIDRGAP